MSYFSTRGGSCATASQAILSGLAPDGGLYVPAMFQPIEKELLQDLPGMSYQKIASWVLQQYLEDFSRQEIDLAVNAAYQGFSDPQIAPVRPINANTFALELFHGPTLAFKDIALQLLPRLLRLSADKCGEKREIAVLTATSGDTGKAALEGFRDVPGTSCTVFYPRDGVSTMQKLQMLTSEGKNVQVVGVQGNFDDAQRGVKALFGSADFAGQMAEQNRVLSSANSMNFGRLVPQLAYYFSTYGDLLRRGAIRMGEAVHFVVPTGNFGDILAGYYARCMGLPIGKLICASNRNSVLTDFFESGTYSTHRVFYQTMSPSMDILVSSNLERLIFEAADRDGALVSLWMNQLSDCGSYSIGEQRLEWLRGIFDAGTANDLQTAQEIHTVFERDNYLMDPHTAVASSVLGDYRRRTNDHTPAVIVSTASPYKFPKDVLSALHSQDGTAALDPFAAACRLSEVSGVPIPPQIADLRNKPVLHHWVCKPDVPEMADAVLNRW